MILAVLKSRQDDINIYHNSRIWRKWLEKVKVRGSYKKIKPTLQAEWVILSKSFAI